MDVVILNDCANPVDKRRISRYIGPYKIAHHLRQAGYTVQVIDFVAFMTEEEVMKYLRKFVSEETKMVAVSTTFLAQRIHKQSDGYWRRMPETIVHSLKQLRAEVKKPKFVLGGYMAEHIEGFGVIDYRITSNAEATAVELVDYLAGVHPELPTYVLQVPMFDSRKKMAKVITAPKRLTYNIETENFKFNVQDCIVHGETLPLEVSRGCIFKCKFCQHENIGRGKLDYLRSMDCVKEELIHNFNTWGTTRYYVLCDTFNDTEYKVRLWHDMTKTLPFQIRWNSYIRVDLIHRYPDTAIMLQDSGMVGAYHGIESLHPKASSVVGKAWSGKHAKEYIPKLYHDVWGGKVQQHLNFICGLHPEPRESILETADWFIQNSLHSIYFETLGLMENGYRHQSEFERDATKYGYSFYTHANGERHWQTDYWNFEDAAKFSAQVNARVLPYTKFSGWRTLACETVGMSLEDAGALAKDFKFNLEKELNVLFVRKYMKLLDEIV